jgi:hypothetical protein
MPLPLLGSDQMMFLDYSQSLHYNIITASFLILSSSLFSNQN